jgi:sulfite oxidase
MGDALLLKRRALLGGIAGLAVLSARAAGPQPHQLDSYVTPTDSMCVEGAVPSTHIDPAAHRLRLTGLVRDELEYSLQELAQSFRTFTTQGVLECDDGIGCPTWTGVRLADVLGAARVLPAAAYVASAGAAGTGRALPLAKATDADTLIAWAMNGAALPREHGFPLRLVAPGWSAAASTKWLQTLTVVALAPQAARASPPASIITSPAPGAGLKAGGLVAVRGYAWVGEGSIARVEVSTDGGTRWRDALLWHAESRHAWRRFTWDLEPASAGRLVLAARAWDAAGNMQTISQPVEIVVEAEG